MRRGDVDDETDKTKQDRPQATSHLVSHCTLCSRKLDARWTISKLSSDRTNRLSVHLTSPWSPLSGLWPPRKRFSSSHRAGQAPSCVEKKLSKRKTSDIHLQLLNSIARIIYAISHLRKSGLQSYVYIDVLTIITQNIEFEGSEDIFRIM
jgi:hypothetical protein